jgi:hypothetical protein
MAHTSEHLAVLGNFQRHHASEKRGRRSIKTCWNSSNAIFVWGFFLSRHRVRATSRRGGVGGLVTKYVNASRSRRHGGRVWGIIN